MADVGRADRGQIAAMNEIPDQRGGQPVFTLGLRDREEPLS